MGEDNIKTRVVGVDISNERTTYAIVDIRGNIVLTRQSILTLTILCHSCLRRL